MTFTREKDTEAWIRKEVEKLGGVFMKFTSPGNDGVPDRIAIFPDSRLVFVELKKEDGKLTKIQEHQIGRLIRLHQQVCVVRGRKAAEEFMTDMKEHSMSSVDYWPNSFWLLDEEGR